MREQVFRVGPALVLFADQVLHRHFDVVEKDLVDFRLAVEQHHRAHGDAGGLHVDQQEADAGLRLAFIAGAHQAEDPFAVLAQRGPGLLAVDDVFVALTLGFGLDRCQVGARAGLAVALAPPYLATGNAGQKALLLLRRAKRHDDWRHHHRAKRQHARRTGQSTFFFKQVLLDRTPAGAAKGGGPGVTEPALFAQNLAPTLQVVSAQAQGVVHLV